MLGLGSILLQGLGFGLVFASLVVLASFVLHVLMELCYIQGLFQVLCCSGP